MVLSETYYKSVFGFEGFSEKLPHSGVEQVSYLGRSGLQGGPRILRKLEDPRTMLRGTGDLERKRLGLCACCLKALKCCSLRTGWRIVFIAHEEQSRCYKLRTLNTYITWVMSTGGPASSKRGSCLFLPEEVFSPRNASLSDFFQKTQKCSCENSVFKWSQWIYDFIKTLWGAIQSKSTGVWGGFSWEWLICSV